MLYEVITDMGSWENMIRVFTESDTRVRIAMVGKYINLSDSYKSINEALFHGGIANNTRVEIVRIDSEELEKVV